MKAAKISILLAGLILAGCASKFLKYEKAAQLKDIKEFDQQVTIEAPELPEEKVEAAPPAPVLPPVVPENITQIPAPAPLAPPPAPKPVVPQKPKKEKKTAVKVLRHLPELEGQAGFNGRRPIRDPFRVGEKVVHEVSYFAVKAGELTLAVKPFAQVNGRKNYHFHMGVKTSSLFSSFYSADDYVSSLMDFETMIPSVFTLHVKETAQLREARFFIDQKKKMASYWEKKVTDKSGEEETKMQWEVPDYSQNVFSIIFYLRAFPWEVGKENVFRFTDNAENLLFRAKALRREKLYTSVGEFTAIVIKPDVELRGQFKPVGDIFIWLSDDDRKFILRIESKIKIGTLVSQIIRLDRGKDEQ